VDQVRDPRTATRIAGHEGGAPAVSVVRSKTRRSERTLPAYPQGPHPTFPTGARHFLSNLLFQEGLQQGRHFLRLLLGHPVPRTLKDLASTFSA
jgi:hypothetical protein